jgi:hypothetical protein
MKLTISQINELSAIIQRNHALVIDRGAGINTLTESDKLIFRKCGIDLNQLYLESTNTKYSSFHFGLICDSLKELESIDKLTYYSLLEYISKGKYFPLTKKEITIIKHIRTQSLSHLESVEAKIFEDVNQILPDSSRALKEAFLREEIEKGVFKRQNHKPNSK